MSIIIPYESPTQQDMLIMILSCFLGMFKIGIEMQDSSEFVVALDGTRRAESVAALRWPLRPLWQELQPNWWCGACRVRISQIT